MGKKERKGGKPLQRQYRVAIYDLETGRIKLGPRLYAYGGIGTTDPQLAGFISVGKSLLSGFGIYAVVAVIAYLTGLVEGRFGNHFSGMFGKALEALLKQGAFIGGIFWVGAGILESVLVSIDFCRLMWIQFCARGGQDK